MPGERRSPGRHGWRWRQMVARVKAEESRCWLCGLVIDRALRAPDPMSYTVDHITPIAMGGDPLARANLHAAHLHCNVVRSNKLQAQLARERKLKTSRRW